ncbi:hypothetical protein [Providencia sp. PROV019]|uniref:hypothetical protein n=1 Tax=Providencia sp. PROV019 TaxID=2949754 RepID=UPI002349F8D4|nr:hypothetical protein [Providencia sp. PROV019]
MTVSTEISSNEYTGNGVTTDFDYKFRIFKANQLSVITSDADGDNVVTLRLGTDYTVTGANKSTGGKVVLTKPLANGHKISIARDIPITQETSFRNQSKFFAETHEDAFDYLTMILQRIWGSLGSLYLKRPNILANWFDAKGYRIANLGKPKRDSDAVDLGTLKDEISGVNSTILKREKRLLRVDDMDTAALPKASDRAGNVLTFDRDGKPIVVAPASGSAIDVLNQLAKPIGAILIGGVVLECSSVSDAVQILGIDEGRKVRTYKYNVDVITDWFFTKTKPTGSEFFIDATDGYLVLLTPNFASAGIIEGAYNPQSAANNRNVIQKLVRDERFDNFNFGCVGLFYVLGSIHPLRDNIKINHEKGITLLGRYNDPAIPPNIMGLNAGQMWGFAHYKDPDSPVWDEGNYIITKVTKNVTYILDGEIGTEYNDIHSAKHNNNPIGWAKSYNCHVIGRGGIVCSDHKGVTFDLDADMCSIDIEYVRNTSNAPVQMKCIDGGYGSIKVNSVSNILFDGGITKSVAWCQGGSHDVTVNKFEWDGAVKPILVYANGCEEVNINAGVVNGVSQICRQLNTSVVRMHSAKPKNTDSILNKAENTAGLVKSSEIRGVRALDNTLTSVFYDETKLASQQDQVVIVDNDFRKASSSFLYFKGKETQNIPRLWDVRNNVDPDGLINFSDWNLLVGQSKTQTVAASNFTITVNRRFENISVSLSESATARFLNINLKAHLLTTVTVSYPIGNTSLVVSRSGDNLTFSLNAGTINFYTLS